MHSQGPLQLNGLLNMTGRLRLLVMAGHHGFFCIFQRGIRAAREEKRSGCCSFFGLPLVSHRVIGASVGQSVETTVFMSS